MSFKDYTCTNPLINTNTNPNPTESNTTMNELPADLVSQVQAAINSVSGLEDTIKSQTLELDSKDVVLKQSKTLVKTLTAQVSKLQDAALTAGPQTNWADKHDTISGEDLIKELTGSSCVGLDETLKQFIAESQAVVNPHYEWPEDMNPTDLNQYVPRKISGGHHVLFTGPTGTGKTETAQNLFAHKHGAWAKVSFHMGTKYGSLFAQLQADNGRTYSMLGVIVLSMMSGVPLILDEVDHCDEFVQSMLHEIVERRSVFIPEINKTIHAADGWQCIATCNSLGDDTGAYHGMMGTAFADRFAVWHVGYPDLKTEIRIIDKTIGKKNPKHKIIAKMFKDLRSKVGEELTGPFSLRRSIQIAQDMTEGIDEGLSVADSLEQAAMANLIYRNARDEQKVIAEVYQAHVGEELSVSVAK